MPIYNYRFCRIDEIDRLKKFIDEHWHKGHILSKSDELIIFQHEVPGEDYLTFAIAENQETGDIDGVYGYINYWKYAPSHHIPKSLWGAVWKVRDDVHNKEIGAVGMGLMRFIFKNDPTEIWSSLGISGKHKDIAVNMNYRVGDMNRYYFANHSVDDYKIIKNPEIKHLIHSTSYVSEIDLPQNHIFSKNINPYKDIEYFENRYKAHPFFKYRYLGLYQGTELKGLFVFRKVNVLDTCVLRIMDFIGDLTDCGAVSESLQKILEQEKAEYIDCLNYGLHETLFEQLGFSQAQLGGTTIIPEYFDPFEQRYVPMEYAYIKDDDTPLVIFKADGDQDRPNSIKTTIKQ